MRQILTILLLALSTASHAEGSNIPFCEWLGDAANTVAQNRDNGIKEYELIGKYLQQSKSYGEQSVVIPLIDRIYNFDKDLNPEEVAFVEQQKCEIVMMKSFN